MNATQRAVTLAVALAAGLGACGGDHDGDATAGTGSTATTEPADRPSARDVEVRLRGGVTKLRVDDRFNRVLDTVGVEIRPTGAARRATAGIALPVRGGTIEDGGSDARVKHGGGFRLAGTGPGMTAEKLVVDTERETVTAAVDGRRIDLFELDSGDARERTEGTRVTVSGIEATLPEETATLLNDALGLDRFEGGEPVGSFSVRGVR